MAPASVPDDDPPTTTTPPRRSSSRVSFALADLPGLTPFAPAESPTALSRASSYVSFGSLWASRSGSLDKDDDDDAPDVEPPADEPPPVPLSEAERRGAAVEARRELVRQTLRDVRAAIARPSDEPSYRPPTLEGVLVLAILKSARSCVSLPCHSLWRAASDRVHPSRSQLRLGVRTPGRRRLPAVPRPGRPHPPPDGARPAPGPNLACAPPARALPLVLYVPALARRPFAPPRAAGALRPQTAPALVRAPPAVLRPVGVAARGF